MNLLPPNKETLLKKSVAMKGKVPWNKGIVYSAEQREKMGPAKGSSWPDAKKVKICYPQCGKISGGGNMTRYHFINCKSLIFNEMAK